MMIEYPSTKQFDTYVKKENVLGGNIEILQVQQLKCDRNFNEEIKMKTIYSTNWTSNDMAG